jgi:hypothetical protein
MRRISILLTFLAVCFVTAAQAQTAAPAPKPDPAVKKLAALLSGRWTYDGEYKAGPLGPGGKITGVYTGQTVLKGFCLEARETETGSTGVIQYLEIDAYDPANKNIASSMYGDDGTRFFGTVTVKGNTITWEGKWLAAGAQFMMREPFVLAADSKSGTAKGEISTDGKTWAPFFEAKFTKVQPASKK